ncbi:pimeloyl-ACP methyl ester esterase BioH, partial [Salmonella enterica]
EGLVPRKIAQLIHTLLPNSKSQIMAKAAHATFISHPAAFCQALMTLKTSL